jgi:hypothetical protein
MFFMTYMNNPINKNVAKKKPKPITVLKKEGGGAVRRGMIMITDSMVFFLTPSLRKPQNKLCVHS